MAFDKNDISGIENALDRYLYHEYNYETEYFDEISAEYEPCLYNVHITARNQENITI